MPLIIPVCSDRDREERVFFSEDLGLESLTRETPKIKLSQLQAIIGGCHVHAEAINDE